MAGKSLESYRSELEMMRAMVELGRDELHPRMTYVDADFMLGCLKPMLGTLDTPREGVTEPVRCQQVANS